MNPTKRGIPALLVLLLTLASCTAAITDAPATSSELEQTSAGQNHEAGDRDEPVADPVGGFPDFEFEYYYAPSLDSLEILTDIVGYEESSDFFDNVVTKGSYDENGKFDYTRIWLREGIEYFNITKEDFIKANEANRPHFTEVGLDNMLHTDAVIDGLYLDDKEARIQALKNPNVLYRDGVFVSIYDLLAMSEEASKNSSPSAFSDAVAKTGFSYDELTEFSKGIHQKMVDRMNSSDYPWLMDDVQPQFETLWSNLSSSPDVPSPVLPEPSPFIHPLDDTISPFSADECALGNVRIRETKPEELADALGVDPQDVKMEIVYSEPGDPDSAILETSYVCGNVRFRVFPKVDGYEEGIDSISVTGDIPWQTPRDIKVGDSFESVLLKFPRERQYSEDEQGFFYGFYLAYESNTPAGNVSASIDSDGNALITIRLITSGWADPFLGIDFRDGIVTNFSFGYPGM
jgi:hypothetical protein